MLHIRKDQMQLLQANAMNQFIDQTVSSLEDQFPDECTVLVKEQDDGGETGDPTRDLVTESILNAADFNISGKSDLARYCQLTLLYGLHFHSGRSWRWAIPLLNDQSLEPTAKLDFIEAEIERLKQENPTWPV